MLALVKGGQVTSAETVSHTRWRAQDQGGAFIINGHKVTATSLTGHAESRLEMEAPIQDFVLEFEFRQDIGAPAAAIEFRGRYRCSLSGEGYGGIGAIAEPAGRGWLYPLSLNPDNRNAARPGEWNRIRLEAVGPSIRTWVNGRPVAHLIDVDVDTAQLALWLAPAATTLCLTGWRAFRLQPATDPTTSAATDPFVRSFLPNQLSLAERAQGWSLLWDGRSTAGWRGAHRQGFPAGGWRLQGDALILAATPEGGKRPGGDLVTEELFSAFEFQFDFLLSPGANSGVKYFVSEDYKPASGITAIGLEFQLLDDARHPDAKRGTAGNRTLGSLYDILPASPPPPVRGLTPIIGQWQHGRIVVYPDQRVEHWLNGVLTLSYVRGSPEFKAAVARSAYAKFPRFGLAAAGRLLLQDHGNEVRFRNLKVRRLSPVDTSLTPSAP